MSTMDIRSSAFIALHCSLSILKIIRNKMKAQKHPPKDLVTSLAVDIKRLLRS